MSLTEVQKVNRQMLRQMRKADYTKVGKMKKTLMYVDISHLTYEEWVLDRKNYIGGSDTATVLPGNLNPYQSTLELFHEKIGIISKIPEESEATYSGHCSEDYIIDNYWRWHNMSNPTHAERMLNVQKGKAGMVRYCRRVKGMKIYDPRMPWININVDGLIQNTRFEKSPRGLLECKSGLGWVWNQYEAGIPVFYIIQAQTYMLITGLKYCEIAVLLDGRYFKVFPIAASEEIQDTIRTSTKDFWDKVMEGKQIWNDPDLDEEEKFDYLSQIEPPVDHTNALDKYLKERFRTSYKVGKMKLTPEIQTIGLEYLACNKQLSEINLEKTLNSNKLKKIFLDNKVDEVIDANDNVIITNRIEGKKKDTTLRVNTDLEKIELTA